MPAAKISRNDVAEAIRILNQQGIPDPGVHRLRTFLGRGSVTTIARFKNELRQIELERVAPAKAKPLPDPIAELAKRLWDELLSAVEAVEVELATNTEQRLAEKQRQIDHCEAERDQALERFAASTDKLAHTERRAEEQKNEIHKQQTRLGELQGQLDASAVSIENLRERERQLKTTLAELAKQSATRENSLNEQLKQERNRSFESQRIADSRYHQLEKQLQSARENNYKEREHHERMMHSAREKNHVLEETLKTQTQNMETLRGKQADLAGHQEKLNKILLDLEKREVTLEAELGGKNDMIGTLLQRIQELQNLHLETKNHYERNIKQLEMHLSEAKRSCKK